VFVTDRPFKVSLILEDDAGAYLPYPKRPG
jgi:hypothetical protein